eukprot:TRINITY_DN14733_c0_g1_i1.p1 TRINITY_DN14733_c0_g1~~TRINITY_DN14733_c0_g1_i1.p1  ORF type:complete len:521 (+),score=114.37 TRINITY_DN14733_c0_g1_i1:67-1629(+)
MPVVPNDATSLRAVPPPPPLAPGQRVYTGRRNFRPGAAALLGGLHSIPASVPPLRLPPWSDCRSAGAGVRMQRAQREVLVLELLPNSRSQAPSESRVASRDGHSGTQGSLRALHSAVSHRSVSSQSGSTVVEDMSDGSSDTEGVRLDVAGYHHYGSRGSLLCASPLYEASSCSALTPPLQVTLSCSPSGHMSHGASQVLVSAMVAPHSLGRPPRPPPRQRPRSAPTRRRSSISTEHSGWGSRVQTIGEHPRRAPASAGPTRGVQSTPRRAVLDPAHQEFKPDPSEATNNAECGSSDSLSSPQRVLLSPLSGVLRVLSEEEEGLSPPRRESPVAQPRQGTVAMEWGGAQELEAVGRPAGGAVLEAEETAVRLGLMADESILREAEVLAIQHARQWIEGLERPSEGERVTEPETWPDYEAAAIVIQTWERGNNARREARRVWIVRKRQVDHLALRVPYWKLPHGQQLMWLWGDRTPFAQRIRPRLAKEAAGIASPIRAVREIEAEFKAMRTELVAGASGATP